MLEPCCQGLAGETGLFIGTMHPKVNYPRGTLPLKRVRDMSSARKVGRIKNDDKHQHTNP